MRSSPLERGGWFRISIPPELDARPTGAWNLLVRVSPLSILACILGMSALFLPWWVLSTASAWDPFIQWTDVHEYGLLFPLRPFDYDDPGHLVMVYLIVIGSFAVLFTPLGSGLIASGLIVFLDEIWQHLGTRGIDILSQITLGLGFYFSLAACVIGAISVIPRLSPSIKLKKKPEETTV